MFRKKTHTNSLNHIQNSLDEKVGSIKRERFIVSKESRFIVGPYHHQPLVQYWLDTHAYLTLMA